MLEVTEDIIPLTLEVLIDGGDFAVSSEAILACCSSHCSVVCPSCYYYLIRNTYSLPTNNFPFLHVHLI